LPRLRRARRCRSSLSNWKNSSIFRLCTALELVAVIACPHVGLLASKLGGKASTNLGAPQKLPGLSDRKQCALLSISRSSFYNESKRET
jgi:hypothetical protein